MFPDISQKGVVLYGDSWVSEYPDCHCDGRDSHAWHPGICPPVPNEPEKFKEDSGAECGGTTSD